MAVAAVVADQTYTVFSGSLTVHASLLGALVVPLGVFGLVILVVRGEGRPWREYGLVVREGVPLSLVYTTVFALLFLVFLMEPGFLFGFGRRPPVSSLGFGFLLFYGPIVALAQGSVFLGLLFRRLTGRVSFVTAMLIASTFSALATTNLPAFLHLSLVDGIQLLFTTTLTSFVLGLVLALYFYKARWSLLGPVALQAVVIWILDLFPYGANLPTWEDNFAVTLVAYVALLVAVAVLMREPRLQAQKYLGYPRGPRRYRFRERAENRQAARGIVAAIVVVVVVVGTVDVGLPALVGTPTSPLLAIATGSMAPTLERGTLILIEKATPGQIQVGTIIAFDVGCLPAPTVHRVVRILVSGASPVYLTKGDANPSPDPCTVPYSHVIGKGVVWVPYIGYLILDPLFAAALIALVAISLALVRRPRR